MVCYGVLFKVSSDYPPVKARLHTCYAPVRRSPSTIIANCYAAPRLACVRPAASVYPEPGSNSPLLMLWFVLRLESNVVFGCFFCTPFPFCFFTRRKFLCSSVKRFWLSHSFKERFGVPPLFSEAFLWPIPYSLRLCVSRVSVPLRGKGKTFFLCPQIFYPLFFPTSGIFYQTVF